MNSLEILIGDCREQMRTLADGSVQTCVTSPPYFGLRDYGVAGQLGLEPTPDDFVAAMVDVFREVRRVLANDGTLWVNLGDSYASGPRGNKPGDTSTSSLTNPKRQDSLGRGRMGTAKASSLAHKQLIGIPWRVAFALQADGWYLRQDIIWHKPNPMPESVRDRCTKAHEYIFMLSKSPRYYFNAEAIKEPAVNVRPQRTRAEQLAAQYGLTPEHLEAVRSVGRAEVGGKAYQTMTGAGNNASETQRLADEAKKALGGYFREFTFDDTRNKRSVWSVTAKPYKGAHFATFPPDLIEPCILAGSRPGDTVLDPFGGSGTTAGVAVKHRRKAVLCELNPEYVALVSDRIASIAGEGWDLL